jgi:hypothetical protein
MTASDAAAAPKVPPAHEAAGGGDEQPVALAWTLWTLILVAGFALSLLRVMAVNLPWHLATARLAQESGHWPAVNTFSYTFPDYPVYQQYPAFQATMWAILRLAGWEGLSVATAVGWMLAFVLVARWGGTFRQGARFHVLWMLALWALQRRMIMRPDMFSMIAFGCELCALDAFARGRTRALALVPIAHVFWVNSHQLWPLSLIIQAMFAADLAWRRDRRRARLAALALGASVLLTFATPLGFEIWRAPLRTAQSLTLFRQDLDEFHRIWTMSHESTLALATGLPAAWALWRTRRRLALFDLGLWLMSLGLVLSAVRGLMFFGVVSVAVFQRCVLRTHAAGERMLPEPLSPITRRILRVAGVAVTLVTAGTAVYYRWVRPPFTLGGTQAGLGRAWGGWAEEATTFIRGAPPPGRMMNLGMGLGDDVLFWVPGIPVFVDSRLESYPPEFLQTVIASQTDDAKMDALIDRYDVQWVFAAHHRKAQRERVLHLLRGGWQPVYVDSGHIILLRPSTAPATQAYLRDHRIDLRHAQPGDIVAAPAAIRKEQQESFAALMAALERERAR